MLGVSIIPDKLRAVVAKVNDDLATIDGFLRAGESLHFDHGHIMEIAGKYNIKGKQLAKYPVVILVEDFEHEAYAGMLHLNLRLFIANFNPDQTMEAPERWDTIVKLRLMPIYNLFMAQLAAGGFSWDKKKYPGNEPYNKFIVRTRFGVWMRETTTKGTVRNILNDPLDAIEIYDLKINTKLKTC